MRLIILLPLILLCGVVLFGQEQEKGIYLGLSVFPNISNGFTDKNDNNSEYYRGIESAAFSYSCGLKMNIHLKNDFGISTGVNLMKTEDQSLTIPMVHLAGPPGGPPSQQQFNSDRKYNRKDYFIELPINFYKKFSDQWFLTLGASPIWNFKDRHIVKSALKSYPVQVSSPKNSDFGLTANLGIGYVLNFGPI